ncbi:MAG: hypothetical protein AAF383_31085 [Cyanobacteria bacterium P01_A01_bin.83]
MFENFHLPSWFDASSKIEQYLIKLWNKSYLELYDNDFSETQNITTGTFEQDIYNLVQLLNDAQNSEVFHSRIIYLNWVLCLACKPTIDVYCLDKYDTSQLKFILEKLEQWKTSKIFDQDILNCQIEIERYPGVIGEAIMVYQNMIEITNNSLNLIELVLDSIDSCILGAAICPGSKDKRAIFNWILIEVFPAIYYLKLPAFIYTYKYEIKQNWSYQKYKA